MLGKPRDTGRRAAFRPPPAFEPITSLFVNVAGAYPDVTLTLQHDYPPEDFAPAVGWKVDMTDKTYTITAVAGRELTCGGA